MEEQVRILEERVKGLETTIVTMRESAAATKTLVSVIHTDMKDIKEAINKLTAAMNQGKGSITTLVTAASIVGGFVTWLATKFFGEHL